MTGLRRLDGRFFMAKKKKRQNQTDCAASRKPGLNELVSEMRKKQDASDGALILFFGGNEQIDVAEEPSGNILSEKFSAAAGQSTFLHHND